MKFLAEEDEERVAGLDGCRCDFSRRERHDLTHVDLVQSLERDHSEETNADVLESGNGGRESDVRRPGCSQTEQLLRFGLQLAGKLREKVARGDDAFVDQMTVGVDVGIELA